jgi:hypothetical protein
MLLFQLTQVEPAQPALCSQPALPSILQSAMKPQSRNRLQCFITQEQVKHSFEAYSKMHGVFSFLIQHLHVLGNLKLVEPTHLIIVNRSKQEYAAP